MSTSQALASPTVLHQITEKGFFTIDLPSLSCAQLEIVRSQNESELSLHEITALKNFESQLSTISGTLVAAILSLLELPEDALDFMKSQENSGLKDISNSMKKENLHLMTLEKQGNFQWNVHIGDLLRSMAPMPIPVSTPGRGTGLAYFNSIRFPQTFLQVESLKFYPSKYQFDHDVYNGKKISDLPGNLSYLCRLMAAIDSAIMYHLAINSRDFVELSDLADSVSRLGANLKVTKNSLHQINHVWKGCYHVTNQFIKGAFCLTVGCASLPAKAESRKREFELACHQYLKSDPLGVIPSITENTDTENVPVGFAPNGNKSKALARKKLLTKQASLGFSISKKKGGSILERVRAKEQASQMRTQLEAQKVSDAYRGFVSSHLPSICKALVALTSSGSLSKSYSLSQIIQALSDSLASHVSPVELQDALKILCEKAPGFCTIISVGKVSGVRLNSGWSLNQLMSAIKV